MLWNKRNGTIVDVNKEQDVYFEECEELRDIEREYDFLFDAVTDLHGDNLLSYEALDIDVADDHIVIFKVQ